MTDSKKGLSLREKNEKNWNKRYDAVCSLLKRFSCTRGVEIGVAFGGNAEYMLSNTPLEKLWGVDPYRHRVSYVDGMNISQGDFDLVYQNTLERLAPFGSRYEHIRKSSGEASEDVPDELDFVYFDGDHSYVGVLTDLRVWFEKVREGGLLMGDDYRSRLHPGVTKAVHDFFGHIGWEVNDIDGHVWWVQRQATPTSLPLFSQLFLFNKTARDVHWYVGMFYNATIGRIRYYWRRSRKRIRTVVTHTARTVLPRPFYAALKRLIGR